MANLRVLILVAAVSLSVGQPWQAWDCSSFGSELTQQDMYWMHAVLGQDGILFLAGSNTQYEDVNFSYLEIIWIDYLGGELVAGPIEIGNFTVAPGEYFTYQLIINYDNYFNANWVYTYQAQFYDSGLNYHSCWFAEVRVGSDGIRHAVETAKVQLQ